MKKVILFSIIFVSIVSVSTTSIFAQSQYEIPEWIKNNVNWWADEQIDDSAFVSGIEFLISEEIIDVPITQKSVNTTDEIPSLESCTILTKPIFLIFFQILLSTFFLLLL